MSIRSGPQIEHGSRKAVYLDYAATTPVDPQVIEVMIQCLGLDGDFWQRRIAITPLWKGSQGGGGEST